MPSHLYSMTPPYELPSDIVYFHDWRWVQHGGLSWVDDAGSAPDLFTRERPPRMDLSQHDIAHGVCLRAQPTSKSEPVFTPDIARTEFVYAGSLLRDGGRYRLWYETWPDGFLDDRDLWARHSSNALRYAESDDGFSWRPSNIDGSGDNIVYGAHVSGTGYHGGCVFLDPSARSSERYRGVNVGQMTLEMMARYRRERPDEIDPRSDLNDGTAFFGSTSPDGVHWTSVGEPLVAHNGDFHNVCLYDEISGSYALYVRSWIGTRRGVGRSESRDFRRFPLPETLMGTDPSDAPHDLWYTTSVNRMPGAPDYWVMFPKRWHLPTDKFSFHISTSADGVHWTRVPTGPNGEYGPVCEPGPTGAWDAGLVDPGLGLVDLPGDRIGLLYGGASVPYKHPRTAPYGGLAWAWWPKGRLVALEAKRDGAFAIVPIVPRGREIQLNALASTAGHILAEVCDERGSALPGRSFDDCDPVSGDELDRTVRWQGQSDLGHEHGRPVILRFRMRAAKLFSIRFA